MADDQSIFEGFYKGVPIRIASSSVEGGRRKSVKSFPNRDTESVEDMGRIPRRYTLEIIIAGLSGSDYFAYRNQLLAAIETDPAPGVMIHPLYGRIENVVASTYSISEDFSDFGYTTVRVEFRVNGNVGIPQSSGTAIPLISEQNTITQSSVARSIASGFTITGKNIKNIEDVVAKVTAIVSKVDNATKFIGEVSDRINTFNATVGTLSGDVNGLVRNPVALADSINGLFLAAGGLSSSASTTFDIFKNLFGFGDDDNTIYPTTSSLTRRAKNRSVLNAAVGSAALGYAYLSASQINYETTEEIDKAEESLEEQFAAVQATNADQDIKDNLADMRLLVTNVLQEARLRASAIKTISTRATTARVLAFDYYGSDELGATINDINNFANVAFVEGDVRILTK